jgi:hypothetical protein
MQEAERASVACGSMKRFAFGGGGQQQLFVRIFPLAVLLLVRDEAECAPVACGSMKRLPLVPADSSMHACPTATPTPTVWHCTDREQT